MPTMNLSYVEFPSGTVLLNVGSIPVPPKTTIPLSAPPTLFGSADTELSFIFWDANATPQSAAALSFTTPDDDSTFAVEAWYLLQGPGGPGTGVTTVGFALNSQKVLPGTVISSVNPPGAQTGPNTVSTTTSSSPVQITADATEVPFGVFNSWLQFGNGSASKDVLTVPANGASMAIAFYGIPVPDPCQSIRDEINNPALCDGLPTPACEALRKSLNLKLQQCEKTWGEIA